MNPTRRVDKIRERWLSARLDWTTDRLGVSYADDIGWLLEEVGRLQAEHAADVAAMREEQERLRVANDALQAELTDIREWALDLADEDGDLPYFQG